MANGKPPASSPVANFPQGDPRIHGIIKAERDGCPLDFKKVYKYKRYARGEQELKLTDEQKEMLQGILDNEFADNVCNMIVSDAADRVELMRYECPDNATVQEYLQDWFNEEGFEDLSDEVHFNILRDGNAVLAMNYEENEERPVVYLEEWWDGQNGVFIGYDDCRNAAYGVKEWTEFDIPGLREMIATELSTGVGSAAVGATPGFRRNVWYPDRLERWVSIDRLTWMLYPDPDDDGRSIVPWVDTATGEGLGVPYIPFANANRRFRNYGSSELSGGILGFQDQINDIGFDLCGAGRMTGFQMLMLAGVNLGLDSKGEPNKPKVGPGQTFTSTDFRAKAQVIPAGDISQLVSLYKEKLRGVARVSRTPLHVLGLEWPSGEAILQAERPAVNKARKNAKRWSRAWTAVAYYAVKLANRFGGKSFPTDIKKAKIISVMSDVERRDPLTQSVIVNNLGDKISQQEALQLMGYQPERAQAVINQKQAEDQAAMDQQVKLMTAQAAITPPGAPKDVKKKDKLKPPAKPSTAPTGGPQAQQ